MGRAKMLKVAWLSVGLGLVMEAALLVAAAGFSKVPGLKPIVADIVQKVSWSFIVCVGLASGAAASKSREAAMGLMGLFAAPAGFHVARVLHKSALQALNLAGPMAGGVPGPLVLALLKALEYSWLGAALARLSKRSSSAAAYAGLGLVTGVVFAGLILWLSLRGAARPMTAALVSKGINELLFPVGCSLVLCAAESAGRATSGSS